MFGEYASLWQLAVALNLGFGALYSFGEPTKDKITKSLIDIEAMLAVLIAQKNGTTENDTDKIFYISSAYLHLNREFYQLTSEWGFLYSYKIRAVIIGFSIVAFVGLLYSAVSPKASVNSFEFFVVILLNVAPISLAAVHFILSLRLKTSVYPLAVRMQSLIRTTYYTEYLDSSSELPV